MAGVGVVSNEETTAITSGADDVEFTNLLDSPVIQESLTQLLFVVSMQTTDLYEDLLKNMQE